MKQSKHTRRFFNLVAFAGVLALAGAGGIVAAQAQQKGGQGRHYFAADGRRRGRCWQDPARIPDRIDGPMPRVAVGGYQDRGRDL